MTPYELGRATKIVHAPKLFVKRLPIVAEHGGVGQISKKSNLRGTVQARTTAKARQTGHARA